MNDTQSPSSIELRLKAEACHRAAMRAADSETRANLLSLMAAWREIAGQVQRVEQAHDRARRRSGPGKVAYSPGPVRLELSSLRRRLSPWPH